MTAQTALTHGRLDVRLASEAVEVDAAQRLRYRVFYEECGARPSAAMARARRDFDDMDPHCDHLLVIDRFEQEVVGTYRLVRRSHARAVGRFYTAAEFDISGLTGQPGEILELGRSCVDSRYRNSATMQLLWQGIAAYVFAHDITLMFGCASLPGTDPGAHAVPLSYLHHHHTAPAALRPRALPDLYRGMDLMPADGIQPRRALASLPPLVKGYLRLGGWVGDGAVIDEQFNTTDVCVVVQTDAISSKYQRHYGLSGRRPH